MKAILFHSIFKMIDSVKKNPVTRYHGDLFPRIMLGSNTSNITFKRRRQ